jgi:diacylglycerol kinase (ATP)
LESGTLVNVGIDDASGGAGAAASRRCRFLIIVNPAAGRRAPRRFAAVLRELERLGCRVTVQTTSGRGDAEAWARAARPEAYDAVVAAGGDGTINEVVNGLVGSTLPLGIIPLGTANVLAVEIGAPRSAAALATMLAAGPVRQIWPGEAHGRHFLLMAGIGFDARVIEGVDPRLKRRLGKLAVYWEIARQIGRYRAQRCLIRCDGQEYDAASAVIAKARFYGGKFVLAPEAAIAEPHLHLVLFLRGGRVAVLRYLLALALRRVHLLPDVRILRTSAVRLTHSGGGAVQLDGDIAASALAEFGIAPSPLGLIHPV